MVFRLILITCLAIITAVMPAEYLHSTSITKISDVMTSQKAGVATNHTVAFKSIAGVTGGSLVFKGILCYNR
jgi:hypothetical protein